MNELQGKVTPPIIWLIDTGDEVTWCSDPDPVGSGHSGVAYIRSEQTAAITEDRDLWKASEALCSEKYDQLVAENVALRDGLSSALDAIGINTLPIVRRTARIKIRTLLQNVAPVGQSEEWTP